MPRDRATPKRLRFTWNSNKRGDSRSEESSGDGREAGGDAIHLDGKRHAAGAGGGGHMTEEEMLQIAIAQNLEQSGPRASRQEGVGDDCKKPSASDDCDASERFDCIGSSSEEPNTPDEEELPPSRLARRLLLGRHILVGAADQTIFPVDAAAVEEKGGRGRRSRRLGIRDRSKTKILVIKSKLPVISFPSMH